MNEDATAISVLPNQPRVWEVMINFIARLIKKILAPEEQPTYSHPRQSELDKAHKMIRMAQNYGDSYEEVADRIRRESARYKAFKKNPEPIGKVTLNVKQLDSDEICQRQYEVKDPAEGKASVSYTHLSSPDIVLEFVLHDKNDLPLFAIARTYSNWIGSKEFDLGGDRAFYLNMVEDEKPGHVAVQAGFKAKEAALPVLTFPDATSGTRRVFGRPANSWPFKKVVLVASTHLAVIVLCCSVFKLIESTKAAVVQSGANLAVAESTAKGVGVPQITRIIWTRVTPDFGDNVFTLGDETGPRKDRITSKSKRASSISTFAVSVNGTSLDESVRCGRELLNRIQEGVDGEAKNVDGLKDTNCGNTVKFVFSFEPIERKHGNFLFALGDDNQSLFDNEYELGGPEFIGGTNELANVLFRIITGHPDPKSALDNKGSEVAMTE